MPFCKFHGFGNDYIVIEKSSMPGGRELSELARAICDRHRGAGADGIAVVEKSAGDDADFVCEIVNPDGSIAGFSGNGTRCAASYLHCKKIWTDEHLRLKTRSGVKNYRLLEEDASGHYLFEAEIGRPEFASMDVPAFTPIPLEPVVDFPLEALDRTFSVSCVNVGNPVACLFVDGFDDDWRDIGRALEVHPFFPERANIVFVRVADQENIELRIWERGVGETSSSGTCVSGSAALAALTERTGRRVSVQTPGGTTEFHWREDGEMVITGRADLSYCGEWPV